MASMDTPTYSRELREALWREVAPAFNLDATDATITADDIETINGVPVVIDPSVNHFQGADPGLVSTFEERGDG